MSSTPRLYVHGTLRAGHSVSTDEPQGKYLKRVMRLGPGDAVRVFNGRDGEWLCRIEDAPGKYAVLRVDEQLRGQVEGRDLTLLFAPLKKTRTDFVVEKACELGVRSIQPVMTERTQAARVRSDRLQSLVIEAAEQTERLDIPAVEDGMPLARALDAWPAGKPLFYCDEAGEAGPMAEVLTRHATPAAGLLIGPEGGFAPAERELLRKQSFVVPVTLGPRILRAETAAVAALTLWQSLVGDWRDAPYVAEGTEIAEGQTS